MSNEAITRVITNDTSGSASHRLTLIVLADMVNPAGFCWVSLDKLAERVQSVKRRQLVNVLADLESRGEIGVLRRKREQGRNGVNYYVVNVGLSPQQQRDALAAAEGHARANGWISEPDCTNNDAVLVQCSTDISVADCTNQNGISATQYSGLVQSATDISATEYRVLVQPAAPDPSYDPIDPKGGTHTREGQPSAAVSFPPPVVIDYIPDRSPGGNGYHPPAEPPDPTPDPAVEERRQAIGHMANAITDVTGISAKLNKAEVIPLAIELVDGGYSPDQLHRHYGKDALPGGWNWYRDDWRGVATEKRKAGPPRLKEIRETIVLATASADAKTGKKLGAVERALAMFGNAPKTAPV